MKPNSLKVFDLSKVGEYIERFEVVIVAGIYFIGLVATAIWFVVKTKA